MNLQVEVDLGAADAPRGFLPDRRDLTLIE
jgi:hypothetical protein